MDKEKARDIWSKWDNVHSSEDQKKRLASSKKGACTPIKINEEELLGHFKGSAEYETSLDFCPCGDFRKRKLPCKHMYRLAIELNLMDENAESNYSKIKHIPYKHGYSFEKCIDIIETLPIESQEVIYDYLTNYYKGIHQLVIRESDTTNILFEKEIVVEADYTDRRTILDSYKKNEITKRLKELQIDYDKHFRKIDLYDWIFENHSDLISTICSDAKIIKLHNNFETSQKLIRTYLKRKLHPDPVLNIYTGEIESDPLPNDIVTEELKKHGIY